jgi:hypothetical protein
MLLNKPEGNQYFSVLSDELLIGPINTYIGNVVLIHVCLYVNMADDVFKRQKRLKLQPIEIVLSDARSKRWREHVARMRMMIDLRNIVVCTVDKKNKNCIRNNIIMTCIN